MQGQLGSKNTSTVAGAWATSLLRTCTWPSVPRNASAGASPAAGWGGGAQPARPERRSASQRVFMSRLVRMAPVAALIGPPQEARHRRRDLLAHEAVRRDQ